MLSCKHRIATGNRIMVIEHKRELDFHLGRHPVRQSLHNATSNVRVQKEATMQTASGRRLPGQETNQHVFLGGKTHTVSPQAFCCLFVRVGLFVCVCVLACLSPPFSGSLYSTPQARSPVAHQRCLASKRNNAQGTIQGTQKLEQPPRQQQQQQQNRPRAVGTNHDNSRIRQ